MKIQFIDYIMILDQEHERGKEVPFYDIDFGSFFSPLLKESEYEIITEDVYKSYLIFEITN